MADAKLVVSTFETANRNLSWVFRYLMGSPESAGELQMRQIGGLLDAARPLLDAWMAVTGTVRTPRPTVAEIKAINTQLFRTGHILPVNVEGTRIESHLLGSIATLDAATNLLDQATGSTPRPAVVVRKEASAAYQAALHRYGLALRAPDTVVSAVRNDINHENRIELARRLHRGVVDIAAGVDAWAR